MEQKRDKRGARCHPTVTYRDGEFRVKCPHPEHRDKAAALKIGLGLMATYLAARALVEGDRG